MKAVLLLGALLALHLPAHAQTPVPTDAASSVEQRFFGQVNGSPRTKTKTVGGPGGGPFEDVAPAGGVLVGFDLWYGDYSGHLGIAGMRAIYETASGRIRSPLYGQATGEVTTVEAQPGFAVAQLTPRSGDLLDGFELHFWRIGFGTGALNAQGAYKSPWVGGKDGGKARSPLGGNGNPLVGIHGASGLMLDRFGLIVARTR